MRIIYKDNEGLKIIVPSPRWLYNNNMNHVEAMAFLVKKRVPEGCVYKIVPDEEIPTDREFRNAWDLDSKKKIKVDITKAKEIKKDIIRREREPLMKKLDIDYYICQELNEDTSEVIAKKQKLRDITNEVDKIKTVDELKLFKISEEVK